MVRFFGGGGDFFFCIRDFIILAGFCLSAKDVFLSLAVINRVSFLFQGSYRRERALSAGFSGNRGATSERVEILPWVI